MRGLVGRIIRGFVRGSGGVEDKVGCLGDV